MSWIAYDVRLIVEPARTPLDELLGVTGRRGVLAQVHTRDEAERVAARYHGGAPVEIVLVDL